VLHLPIAERELRIGARSNATYSVRRNFAAVVLVIFFVLYWNFGAMGTWSLAKIFWYLSMLCFLYTLAAGVILAADCISSEKREGTLGLLFLTSLKAHDLVAGNVVGSSLKAFYGLMATFPVLGISFVLGGLTYSEFGSVCLTLISTLLFSLSLSLLVSCLSEKHLFATGRAAAGLIFFTFVIPNFCRAVRNVIPTPPRWVEIIELFSPSTTLDLATRSFHGNDFWWSLLIVNAISAAMLLSSCLVLPWVWKTGVRDGSRGLRIRQLLGRKEKTQTILAAKPGLEGRNPFYWLASRGSWESTKFLVGLLALGILASFVGGYNITRGRNPVFQSHVAAWSMLLAAAHAVLLFKFAALATSRLAEDRRGGALELILVTPLKVRQILAGQWQALARQLAGPALAVLFLHALVFWAVLNLYCLDEDVPGGASAALRIAIDGILQGGDAWQLSCIMSIVAGSAIILYLNWIALGWVGMWVALRVRRASWAVWIALGLVLLPPFGLFMVMVSIGVWMGLARGNGSYWAWYCITAGFGLSLIHALALSVWSWRRLQKDFRIVAAERFMKTNERRAIISMRSLIRIALPTAALTLVVLLFYGEEKWRGLRAWHKLEREYAKRGEKLITRFIPPAPIPEAENFGAAELFEPLFDYYHDAFGQVVWGKNDDRLSLLCLTVTGRERSYPWGKAGAEPRANWALQKPTDLAAWQSFYLTNSAFSGRCSTGAAPHAVLKALEAFAPDLEELEKVSHRPQSQFPIHYEESFAAHALHIGLLKNVSDILHLRASAKLASGDIAGARADIQFSFRLAKALKSERGIFAFDARKRILVGLLQPVWEGIEASAWDDAALREFQKEFFVEILTDYQRAVREEAVSVTDFWERFSSSDEKLLTRLGFFPINARAARFYPSGWKYLNEAGLLNLTEHTLLPLVDPKTHRVFPAKATNLARAIRESHVSLDPVSNMMVPWQVQMCGDAILTTAHAQASLDEAAIACALERWRQTRVSLPAKLELLTPEFIERVPVDPVSGAAYNYHLLPNDRFVLYSVGWNEQDDGGEPHAETPHGVEQDLRRGDWVWRYTRE
jgi:hypothetical protein